MAKYTDEDSNEYTAFGPTTEGDPITVDDTATLSENDSLFLSSKAAMLPGACSDCVSATNESGGGVWLWRKLDDGDSDILWDVSENQNIFSAQFDLADNGWKWRIAFVTVWYGLFTVEGDADDCMPGETDDYTIFGAGDGGVPNRRLGYYSGAGAADPGGGAENYDLVITTASNEKVVFYAHPDTGDLRIGFDKNAGGGGSNDYLVIAGLVEFAPRMKKVT